MYNSYGVSSTILDSSPRFVASGIWTIVSVILAIIGGIVLYFTFLSKKNEGKFTGFLGWLYDFLTFKKMMIENVLKILYIIVALFVTLSSFGLISISSPFSEIYFGSDFDGIELTLAILSIELIFMGWSTVFGNQFLVAIDKVKGLTISVVIATVVLLSLSIFLIPIFGSTGATITSVIGEAVIAIVQLYFVNKYVQLSILFKDFYKFLISGLIMLLVCQTVNIFITNNFLNIVVQIIIGGITYFGILFVLKPAIMNFREIGIRN